MNLRIPLQVVRCGAVPNGLRVAARAEELPDGNNGTGTSAIRAAPADGAALCAPAVPAFRMEHVTACESDHTLAIAVWLATECAFFICSPVDDGEVLVVFGKSWFSGSGKESSSPWFLVR